MAGLTGHLFQKPKHHLPERKPEIVHEIAPGQPARGIFFPGRGMEGVLDIRNVAGVESLAQQEGRVDVVAEEDRLQAQLVAGDAG